MNLQVDKHDWKETKTIKAIKPNKNNGKTTVNKMEVYRTNLKQGRV